MVVLVVYCTSVWKAMGSIYLVVSTVGVSVEDPSTLGEEGVVSPIGNAEGDPQSLEKGTTPAYVSLRVTDVGVDESEGLEAGGGVPTLAVSPGCPGADPAAGRPLPGSPSAADDCPGSDEGPPALKPSTSGWDEAEPAVAMGTLGPESVPEGVAVTVDGSLPVPGGGGGGVVCAPVERWA